MASKLFFCTTPMKRVEHKKHVYRVSFLSGATPTNTAHKGERENMREAARQTIGQQKEMASYQTVEHSQDMATVIRQAVVATPSHFSQFALVIIEFHFTVLNNSSCTGSVTHEHSTRNLPHAMRVQTRQNDRIWL